MIDFAVFSKAVKAAWVKRICSDFDSEWKIIPNYYLHKFGCNFLFSCNFDCKSLDIHVSNCPRFYQTVLASWKEVKEMKSKVNNNFSDEIIWNNKAITINSKSLFYDSWYKAGIIKIRDLLNTTDNTFLSYNQLLRKYNIRSHFLQYHSLVSAIPEQWKKQLKNNPNKTISTRYPQQLFHCLSCKKAYNILLLKQIEPPTTQNRILSYGISESDLPLYYLLPFVVTRETKMSMLQYKILHNILPTNLLLYRMNISDTDKCPLCNDCIHSIEHMFTTCTFAIEFWRRFYSWCPSELLPQSYLTKLEILYGVLRNSTIEVTLNHIILIAKYHIYRNFIENTSTNFSVFISLLKEKINTEKYIAYTSHAEDIFKRKWGKIINTFLEVRE